MICQLTILQVFYEFGFWRDFAFRPVWHSQLSWVARVFSTSALQANHFDVTQFTCWNSLETSVLLWLVLREQWFDKFFLKIFDKFFREMNLR